MQKNQPPQTRLNKSRERVTSQLASTGITKNNLKRLWSFLVFTGIMIISCKESVKHIETAKCEKVIPDSATAYVKELSDQQLVRLEDSIVMKGDVEAYEKLRIYYLRRFEMERLLYYSIIMSHKYNNAVAYGDAGDILLDYRTQYEIDSLDSKTKMLVTYFLLGANERGNDIGKYSLFKVFKNGSFPNSENLLNSEIIQ